MIAAVELIISWAASMGIAFAIVARNRHQTFTQKVSIPELSLPSVAITVSVLVV